MTGSPRHAKVVEQSNSQIQMLLKKVRFCETIKFEPFAWAVATIQP
jgi:hypothetical protein